MAAPRIICNRKSGTKFSKGIVGAALQFDQGQDIFADPRLLGAQHGEDCGRVRRGDDAPQQESLQQAEAQKQDRRQADNASADHHADCGQDKGGGQDRANRLPGGVEPPGEQDEDQTGHADGLGGLIVGEADPAWPIRPGQHPQGQEANQGRHSEPAGQGARQNRRQQQQARDEQEEFRRYGGHEPLVRACAALSQGPVQGKPHSTGLAR